MNNLSKFLNKENADLLLHNCENFLFDCDGVIWNWPNLIPGSIEFINHAKQLGKKCFFVTNNSTRTRETFAKQLENFGVKDVDESQIVCTAWILAEYLRSQNFQDKVFLVGNPAMLKELENSCIKHNALNEHEDFIFNSSNYDEIELDPKIKCVAVGIDYGLTFQKLIYASSYLKNKDCIFISTNDDSTLPVPFQDIVIPDAGPILKSIEKTTGRQALVLGKPNAIMWEILSKSHSLDAKKTCMFGDRLDTDILFASNANIEYSVLVLSGITTEKDVLNIDAQVERKKIPSFYTNCLGDLLKFIL
ncbi:unnamed protein product [Brachionus calyciflorus]|uniref:4-nitrophenylphosphatase n=1 Tax=Brachionus calyciflorus TaxID=104777 RepID=A0A813M9B0_9BILA|nr:unnamed protein product [Brachionus calyciflorus]